jgi:hypothetical protein
MTLPVNLWNPGHVTLAVDLLTAFLLGVVHGVTPDEHTWPITFSYAVGGYSTRRGLLAGLTFSLAFTVQRALASELAYLGFARLFTFAPLDRVVDIVVGIVMAAAGLFVTGRGVLPHLPLPGLHRPDIGEVQPRDPKPWMLGVRRVRRHHLYGAGAGDAVAGDGMAARFRLRPWDIVRAGGGRRRLRLMAGAPRPAAGGDPPHRAPDRGADPAVGWLRLYRSRRPRHGLSRRRRTGHYDAAANP